MLPYRAKILQFKQPLVMIYSESKPPNRWIREEHKMTNTRMNQIIEPLVGLGTRPDVMYTNQEVVDHLKALQSALAQGVFEKTHAENLRDRDIMIHFEALAKEYGLDRTETYHRF